MITAGLSCLSSPLFYLILCSVIQFVYRSFVRASTSPSTFKKTCVYRLKWYFLFLFPWRGPGLIPVHTILFTQFVYLYLYVHSHNWRNVVLLTWELKFKALWKHNSVRVFLRVFVFAGMGRRASQHNADRSLSDGCGRIIDLDLITVRGWVLKNLRAALTDKWVERRKRQKNMLWIYVLYQGFSKWGPQKFTFTELFIMTVSLCFFNDW